MCHFIVPDYTVLGIQYLMRHDSVLIRIYNLRVNADLARILRVDGQVTQVSLRNSHQRDIADDAVGCPVIVIVKVAARELRDDTHGQLLSLLFLIDEGRNIEECRIISGAPRACSLAVNP